MKLLRNSGSMMLMLFGLVNVVVGVFCAKATEASQETHDLRLAKEKDKQSKKIRDLVKIFRMIDTENTGLIHWDQFRKFVESPESRTMLQSHGLQLFALENIWRIMDGYDGEEDNQVDTTAFVMGFVRLAGDSMSADLMLLSMKVREMREDMKMLIQELRDERKERRLKSGVSTTTM